MIVFSKVRWKNLLSTGNVFTEIDLSSYKTTLIVGKNGSGKSTILDALSFALFGKPFRKVNKNQLVNSIIQKGLVVEVELSIGAREYKIVRGIRPNVFEIYKDGFILNQAADSRDYQQYLERQILKVNHKSFCQIVVLGSATFQPFMTLPQGQRREIIEDLLDLQIFTIMNYVLREQVQKNNENISDCSTQKRLAEAKIKLVKEHLNELRSNDAAQIEEKLDRVKQTDENLEAAGAEMLKISKELWPLVAVTVDKDIVTARLDKLEQLRHKIEANLAILRNDAKFFSTHANCPTCTQSIEDSFRKSALATKGAEIGKILVGLEKMNEEVSKSKARLAEIGEAESIVRTLDADKRILTARIGSLKLYRAELLIQIETLKSSTKIDDDSRLDDLERELETTLVAFADLHDEKEVLGAAGHLLKDGGIKAKIVKQYIPIINKHVNKYLALLDFFIQFEIDEEFNETIKSRYRDDFSYESFSEGEKMRIDLALLFTWRTIAKLRNSINTNILIMDEVFDSSLDADGTEEFVKILNNLTGDTNVIVISHKTDTISDRFDNTVKFVKHKNFSQVEVQK